MHTLLITSDYKLYWRWIWEGQESFDFQQDLPILLQYKQLIFVNN